MSRTLTFSGTGTLATWREPSGLAAQIAGEMRNAGFGITDLQVTNVPTGSQNLLSAITNPLIAAIPTWNYKLSVTFNSPDDEDVERVRQLATSWFSNWFTDVNIKLTHDSAHPMSTFLQNYGLWIAGGFAALLIFKSLSSTAVAYAPTARSYFVHR